MQCLRPDSHPEHVPQGGVLEDGPLGADHHLSHVQAVQAELGVVHRAVESEC